MDRANALRALMLRGVWGTTRLTRALLRAHPRARKASSQLLGLSGLPGESGESGLPGLWGLSLSSTSRLTTTSWYLTEKAQDPLGDHLALVFLQEMAGSRNRLRGQRARDQSRDPLADLGTEDGIAVREQHEGWSLPARHRVPHSLHRRGR